MSLDNTVVQHIQKMLDDAQFSFEGMSSRCEFRTQVKFEII